MMRPVVGFLRQHLRLLLGLLALLAISGILWHFPAWPLAAIAVLQQHVVLTGALGGGFVILVLLWGLPKWQAARPDLMPQDRFTVENEARKTLAQIVGGAAVLASLYFTWVNLQMTQDTTTKNQEIAREGQITDRFTKAIAQLGDERLAIRIGGIYALERIAKDSERDHWPIMEVLTAYVRENALQKPGPGERTPLAPELTAGIQAVLTVLGRRTRTYGSGENRRLDLRMTNLPSMDLSGANLSGANLFRINLFGANLSGANLSWVDLRGAVLSGANLSNADLSGAHLFTADLSGVDLDGTNFSWANLSMVRLEGARNLKIDQLCKAQTLYQAVLDPSLGDQCRQQCPERMKPQD